MNKFKWVVIPMAIGIFLSGCSLLFDGQDTHVPVDKQYKVVYHIGDILEYHSNTGDVFSLKVMNITKTETAGSKHGSGAPYYYTGHEHVMYDTADTKIANKPPSTIIDTEQPRSYVRWTPGLYGCTSSGCNLDYHETWEINGVTYSGVFKMDPPYKKGEILIWYYSYKQGFVGFEMTGNRVFNLVL